MSLQVHPVPMGMTMAYLLQSDEGLVLLDAGYPHRERRVLRRMEKLGVGAEGELRLIFITHGHLDHYGSAAALRRLTGAPIAVHRADAGAMARGETPLGSVRGYGWISRPLLRWFGRYVGPEQTPPDLLLGEGDDLRAWGLEATVLHAPGHTPGSSCLIVEDRLAFVGDLLSTRGRPHVQRYYASDWALIPKALARLQALQLEWIYPGHGGRPMSGAELQCLRAGGD